MLAAVIALCPISSHHHVTFRDAAVLLSALSQSITISVLAFDSSEPQRAASSTLPPTDPLPFPPSSFPSQHVLCHSCGPRGHGQYDPVWTWWRRRRKSGGWGDGLFVLSGVVPLHSSVVSLRESCSETPRTSSVFAHIRTIHLQPQNIYCSYLLGSSTSDSLLS